MKAGSVLSIVLIALLLGVVGLVTLGDSPSAPQRLSMSQSLGILRSPPESMDTRTDKRSFEAAALVEPHAKFEDTQRVDKRHVFWVLTTNQSLCIAQPRGAACAPKRAAVKNGVVLGTFRPPTKRYPIPHDFLLQGVVPDYAKKVLVVIGKGQHLLVDVKGNVFAVERDDPVRLKRLLRG